MSRCKFCKRKIRKWRAAYYKTTICCPRCYYIRRGQPKKVKEYELRIFVKEGRAV